MNKSLILGFLAAANSPAAIDVDARVVIQSNGSYGSVRIQNGAIISQLNEGGGTSSAGPLGSGLTSTVATATALSGSQASSSVDLARAKLGARVFLTGPNIAFAGGVAQSILLDTLTFNNTTANVLALPVSLGVTGTVSGLNSYVYSSMQLGNVNPTPNQVRYRDGGLIGEIIQYNYNNQVLSFSSSSGSVNPARWDTTLPNGANATIASSILFSPGISIMTVRTILNVDCRAGTDCDYLNSSGFGFGALPTGLSYTSESGVFLTGFRFVAVTPCRLADTREAPGSFGQPALASNTARSFPIAGRCGLPANAAAYSLNVTVVPPGSLGFLTIWPTGTVQPFVSTLNSLDGRIKANAALLPAGTNGAISVFATDATHLVLDVNGYFIGPAANPQALAFYPLTPCRVADTRLTSGALGGPVIAAGASRNFPVVSSNCGVPANAQAYSLNATVVPSGPLGFLTLWPTGQAQPFVSTLNSLAGGIVANAAIVPAGVNGSVSAYVSGPSQSHLVLDINGYFAPATAANAQSFFPVTPCRLLDTRNAAGEFGGPVLAANQSRSYRLPLANCNLPAAAAAFSLNATVVPTATLGFLTLWPTGSSQPFVSTLNALNDAIVANAAIVPAGTAGGVSSFVTDSTHLILDTNGYFAP